MRNPKYAPKKYYKLTGKRHAGDSTYHGCDITPEQALFGKAMERWMRATGKREPTAGDILAVAKSLGYRLAVPAASG